jgi:hypothetical protein
LGVACLDTSFGWFLQRGASSGVRASFKFIQGKFHEHC